MNISQEALDEFDAKVTTFKRELLRPLLAKCNEEQVALFNKMYGNIDEIEGEKMRWAYCQIKNTLTKFSSGRED